MALPDTRLTLLQRLHDCHDVSAWTEFCTIYERAIYRIALKYGLQDADAREVSQEVLLTVSKRIRDFDASGEGRFRSWLAIIARNATIDVLRTNRTSCGDSRLQQQLQNLVASDASGADAFDLEARRQQFLWAAHNVRLSLAESTWLAFWKTAVEGRDKEQVAAELNMSIGAVYVARCRTLAKIRKLVEPFRGRDPQSVSFASAPSKERGRGASDDC